eukprot:CAMPEP_0204514554 /NCGR_PEP_ID=MMETSP0661-20131031/2135_1 /ASSEMBLY_ACC=CAM_ASM_000606 /TAXON_ID=109239 /ORGANISM="Alexandrium margalefi, Strain AMGDE01CS-322" /LENGTH=320 /DNA_ID=CAMNT_0051519801 /DNA_START=142 /DNA_END=1104 /DNA_ORIENTATION=+
MRQTNNYGSIESSTLGKAGVQRTAHGLFPCCNCLVSVPQDRFFAVEHFGQFDKIIGPGLTYVGCDCCGVCIGLRSISRRVEQNECLVETKTKDNVFVLVRVAVQQSVIPEHAESALYKLADVNAQVDSYVADVVRSHVPKMALDEAFENKDSISEAIQEQLGKNMADYGFKIHKALVTELKPSMEVVNSMNEINRQKRLRDAAVMAAEAEKIKIVAKAEADADAARLQGEGTARQRAAIVEGLKTSIAGESDEKLSSERISELLLITQYFETLKEIGANARSQAIFIPHSPAEGVADIAAQIRNGVMQGKAAEPPKQAAM